MNRWTFSVKHVYEGGLKSSIQIEIGVYWFCLAAGVLTPIIYHVLKRL